jgi:spore germination protein
VNISRWLVLIVFLAALAAVGALVYTSAPFADHGTTVASGGTAAGTSPSPGDTSVVEPSSAPTPTVERAFQVAAWSRGSRPSLDRAIAAQALDEVDFDWYHSRADGSLAAEGENFDLLRRAQKAGVRALMTVTNREDHLSPFDPEMAAAILATPQTRRHHIDTLVKTCLDDGYDGVDLDWEMMNPDDRDRFSSLVEELAERLHARKKLLSIAVFPKTSEPGEWDSQKSEDYRRLGAAVDKFKIMTYSFSGAFSKPGPQAPLDWIDEVLTFAESVVPPKKIAMGVPFFGYDWSGDSVETAYPRDVHALQETYRLDMRRDGASKELRAAYTDEKGVYHTIFVVDDRALKAKLQLLVDDHPKIAGIAIWVMGKEEPGFWPLIQRMLTK